MRNLRTVGQVEQYCGFYTVIMKMNSAEVIRGSRESIDLKQMLEEAKLKVAEEQLEASEAEEEAQSLELELLQAQTSHEQKEEAERKGKETSEKIAEVTG